VDSPSAARSTVLRGRTSRYGNVYFAARRRSSRSSCVDRSIEYGLDRGNMNSPAHDAIRTRIFQAHEYVSVFMEVMTKPARSRAFSASGAGPGSPGSSIAKTLEAPEARS